MLRRSTLRRFAALAVLLSPGFALPAEPLPAFGAQAREVTVSGVSSGGYMAVQFHVARSGRVKGAGVIAGGPYYCAQGSVWFAYYNCMTPATWAPLPDVATLKAQAEGLARAGRIDPVGNLAAARAWLFAGARDRTVLPEVVHALKDFYAQLGAATVLVADRPATPW